MTVFYVDLENGNNANDGLSFANRKKTLANASSGLSNAPHEFRVMASPAPVDTGLTASWTYDSETVTLSAAVTATIDNGSAWTASANVTATSSTTVYREGAESANLVIASGFTTGLVAYKAFAATDFSGYEQVSLLLRTSAILASGRLELKLCSDAAGVTAVNTFSIPALGATGLWYAVLLDNAAALGASIQSIALYAIVDPGAVTLNLDNIIACKAASDAACLTHYSLISKDDDGLTEPWFAVDSISGTTVVLCAGVLTAARRTSGATIYAQLKYQGSTAASVPLYKRTPIVLAATDYTGVGGSGSGTSAAIVSCGWDRAAMTSITDQTWISFTPAPTTGFGALGSNYCALSGAGLSHTNLNLYAGSGYSDFNDISLAGVNGGANLQTGSNLRVNFRHAQGFTSAVFAWGNFNGTVVVSGLTFNGPSNSDNTVSSIGYDATNYGMKFHIEAQFVSYLTAILRSAILGSHRYLLRGASVREVASHCYSSLDRSSRYELRNVTWTGMPNISVENMLVGDGFTHDFRFGYAFFTQDTTYRHTASDTAWKLRISSGNIPSFKPARFPVARVACNANETRTVELWFYRTTSNHNGSMTADGLGIAGIDAWVQSSDLSVTGSWQQKSISFTPTVDCVVEVSVTYWCTGYSTNAAEGMWIDDLTVT